MVEIFVNHYDVLGVDRHATRGTIDKAFRVKVLANPEAFLLVPEAKAAEAVRMAREAREILRDPDLRAAFDRTLVARSRTRRVDADLGVARAAMAPADTGLDPQVRYAREVLDSDAFEGGVGDAARRESFAGRLLKLITGSPAVSQDSVVMAQILKTAARYVTEPFCLHLAEALLDRNADAPQEWMAALLEHPALTGHMRPQRERQAAGRAVAKLGMAFPRLKRRFAEAIAIRAAENPDLSMLSETRAAETAMGGRAQRLY